MNVRTSKDNREIVAQLTRKFGLGSENHIARIALAYSLEKGDKLNLSNILDSGGKEYSKSVFFGDNYEVYVGLVCLKYNLHSSDVDIPKYLKMHVDDGLESLNAQFVNGDLTNIFSIIKST